MYQPTPNNETLRAAMGVIDTSLAMRLSTLSEVAKDAFYRGVEDVLAASTSKKMETEEGVAVEGVSALKVVWAALQGRLKDANQAIVQVGFDAGVSSDKEIPKFKEALEAFQDNAIAIIPRLPFDPPAVIPPQVAKADIYALLGAWSILVEGLLEAAPSIVASSENFDDSNLIH